MTLPRNCPACGSAELYERRLLEDLVVASCGMCTLLISDPGRKGAGTFDEGVFRRSIGVVRERQARVIVRDVRRLVSGGTWLDAGAGMGHVLAEARRAGFEIAGLDPDARAVAAARALLGAGAIHQGTLGDATMASGSVDVLSTLDVLEHVHVADLATFAGIVHHLLRPDGVWVIKVPTTEGLYYQAAHLLRPFASRFARRLWQWDLKYPHTVYFNRSSLGRFLRAHEFEVVAASYLPEVPNGTVIDRLLLDDGMRKWMAFLAAPAIYSVNALETLRGRSDSLLVLARPIGPALTGSRGTD